MIDDPIGELARIVNEKLVRNGKDPVVTEPIHIGLDERAVVDSAEHGGTWCAAIFKQATESRRAAEPTPLVIRRHHVVHRIPQNN